MSEQKTDNVRESEPHRPDPPEQIVSLSLFSSYLARTLGWCVVAWFLSNQFATGSFTMVMLSVLIFATPLLLSSFYIQTIHQTRKTHDLLPGSLLYWLVGKRLLIIMITGVACLLFAFVLLIQFHTYSRLQWIIFFMIAPVYWICYQRIKRLLSLNYQPYVVPAIALVWAQRIVPAIMTVLSFSLILLIGDPPVFKSLTHAIHVHKELVQDMTGSGVVFESSQYLALFDGLRAYALSEISRLSPSWALLGSLISTYIIFSGGCRMIGCFVIPTGEYRRIVTALSTRQDPDRLLRRDLLRISIVTLAMVGLLYVPLFGWIEHLVQKDPRVSELRAHAEQKVVPELESFLHYLVLEQIDGDLYLPGTIDKISGALQKADFRLEQERAELEHEITVAFDSLEENVDTYLDWYYSLHGEYGRLVNLMSGELEDYMAEKLKEKLASNKTFEKLALKINQFTKAQGQIKTIFYGQVDKIKAAGLVTNASNPIQIEERTTMTSLLGPDLHQSYLSFENRMTISAGMGIVAGLYAGRFSAKMSQKIVSRVMQRGILKQAAKMMLRVAIGRSVGATEGAGTGSLTGAAVGTVVPGVGTTVGAVGGAIVGAIVVTVSADKALVELEELFGREEFKQKILEAINQVEAELLQQLMVVDAP